ncbi:hypothetical protein [Aggregatibacter kilianii]|uniref:hypothetical protein n=1 Tax=Aggregatibacter kilianii TaxID=2025884 RepID=UPI000D64B586|nr:hypothetical protein [Aggregatibacter kilianii]
MDKIKFRAMRAAGIGCFITLAIIAFFVFTTPTETFIDFLTEVGKLAGGRTTIGVFILASLPPLVGFICYHFWRWVLK